MIKLGKDSSVERVKAHLKHMKEQAELVVKGLETVELKKIESGISHLFDDEAFSKNSGLNKLEGRQIYLIKKDAIRRHFKKINYES